MAFYNDDDNLIHNREHAGGPYTQPVQFADFGQYIESINCPPHIHVGEEILDRTPFIVVRPRKHILKEIFARPLLHVPRKIRVRFYWEGLQVLGSNMESPNCFLLPVPARESLPWQLKVVCLPTCTLGMKPLYVSVEVLREDLILTGFRRLNQGLSLALFGAVVVAAGCLFFPASRNAAIEFIAPVFSEGPASASLGIAALAATTLIGFSKRSEEVLASLKPEPVQLTNEARGTKLLSPGILVKATITPRRGSARRHQRMRT